MLVLSRKPSERIVLTNGECTIEIVAVRCGRNNMRFGIEAPREFDIVRAELLKPKGTEDGSSDKQ